MRGSLGFALIASALLIGWMTVPGAAEANHGFDNEYWNSCGPYGCIGWKQWAVTPYSSLGTAHMDNGGTYCGTSLVTSWANAIVYWNGASTAASFTFPRSDCTPVSFPSVRVVPYSTYNSGVSWWGTVYNYDRDPSSGTWYTCWHGCNRGKAERIPPNTAMTCPRCISTPTTRRALGGNGLLDTKSATWWD